MPGRGVVARGRGRGWTKPPPDPTPPEMTPEQLARLKGEPVTTVSAVPGQFDDTQPTEPHPSTTEPHPSTTPSTATTTQSSSPAKPLPSTTPTQSSSLAKKSTLNPQSDTFIPHQSRLLTVGSGLNVDAQEFVPHGLAVAGAGGAVPLMVAAAPPTDDGVTVADVLWWDGRRQDEDTELMVSAATMLVDATTYPGAFDECAEELARLARDKTCSQDELMDLADMLLIWGIRDPGMRYTAVRVADLLCQTSIKDQFRPLLFKGLQKQYLEQRQYVAERGTSKGSEQERGQFKELAMFFAEMFYRVRVEKGKLNEPIFILGDAVLELMIMLLKWDTEDTLLYACNVLKLTGFLLDELKSHVKITSKLETVMTLLRARYGGPSLSERCARVVHALIQSRAEATPTVPQPPTAGSIEAPVKAVSDWQNYVDDTGNVIEGEDDIFVLGDQDDPEADDEMIREYESFVQAFEDHLLMQEFGPAHP